MSTEAKWTFAIPVVVFVIGIAVLVFAKVLTRRDDRRYDRWGIRTDQQARTKGCVAVEDPTGGDET
jgi:hypothetical protein